LWARSLVRIRHRPPEPRILGSNPSGSAISNRIYFENNKSLSFYSQVNAKLLFNQESGGAIAKLFFGISSFL
jgi:hypothetical protein